MYGYSGKLLANDEAAFMNVANRLGRELNSHQKCVIIKWKEN